MTVTERNLAIVACGHREKKRERKRKTERHPLGPWNRVLNPNKLDSRLRRRSKAGRVDALNSITAFARFESGGRLAAVGPAQNAVFLIGQMRAVGTRGEDMLPRSRKAQALLGYLCLAQGQRLQRSRVAGMIWDRTGEAQARDSLRHALYELEHAGWRLERNHEWTRLDLAGIWIDALERPYRPDLLLESVHGASSSFDHWLASERAELEMRWKSSLGAQLEQLTVQEAPPARRAELARKLLNIVETDETAVRHLMSALADMGDSASAIREYERFRLTLANMLGVLPSDKTVALSEVIRFGSRLRPKSPVAISTQSDGLAASPSGKAEVLNADGTGPRNPIGEPSVAVLPFCDISCEKTENYLAAGLTEDVVESLSRIPGLFVVSRLSAAAVSDPKRPPREIGDALGVRYLLSGTIRAASDRIRLNAELTDTATALVLWTQRFDEQFSDLMEIQDRLATMIVASAAPHLRFAEVRRMRVRRPEDYGPYELLLCAQENMQSSSRNSFERARQLLELAIGQEPHYATALAWLAHWHVLRVGQGWSNDPVHDAAQADYFAKRAVDCDSAEPLAIAVQGHIASYLHREFDSALSYFESALRFNHNAARTWLWRACTYAWMGQGRLAVDDIRHAMALSPYDPLTYIYSGGASLAYIADEQFSRAIDFSLRCIRENPRYTTGHKSLIVALVLLGRQNEAIAAANHLRLLEPSFTIERFRRLSPAYAGPRGALYCEAFARAGVPLSD